MNQRLLPMLAVPGAPFDSPEYPGGTAIGRGAEAQAGASAVENRIQARPAKD
jgi:hypothetical protein